MSERAWIDGNRAAWRSLLQKAIVELMGDGVSEKELKPAKLALHLEDTRAALRSLCADFGDNDWPDDLSLVDVIEKHLRPHLEES